MKSVLLLSLLALLAACATEQAAESAAASAAPTDPPSTAPSASSSGMDPQPIPHTPATAINEDLRDELLARMAEDQAVRTGVAPPGDDRTPEELFGQMDSVDRQNTARMHEILEAYGWPGWSLVGEEGSTAAWVLVQHADLEPEFQELALAYLMGAVAAQDASKGDLAYLIDRVRVAKGLPQVYGTQVGPGPDGDLPPIEDPDNVDARRAEAGLGTLEEYYDELREMFGTPAPSASP